MEKNTLNGLFIIFILSILISGCTEESDVDQYLNKLTKESYYCNALDDCTEVYLCCGRSIGVNKNYYSSFDCTSYKCSYYLEKPDYNLKCKENKCLLEPLE